MASSDPLSQTSATTTSTPASPNQPTTDVTPPIGITPPQILAQDAAAGRRGAAWRLLYWVIENDPRAVVAVSSLDDDRLARHLVEFIAEGTWAGKPFVIPRPLRTAYARTRLRTLFLPGAGIDPVRAERVLLSMAHDKRPAVRETTIYLLGIIGSFAATPILTEALDDPVPTVRLQAAKAIGRVGDPTAIPALLNALRGADEQLGSHIFSALVRMGHDAVPALIERSTSSSAWMRWNCLRALSEISDQRALPVLVQALLDTDHSVVWMAAKGLVRFRRVGLVPLLRLLMTNETHPWLVEAATYVMRELYLRDPKLKSYLEPVIHTMHGPAVRAGTPLAAQKALAQLTADGVVAA